MSYELIWVLLEDVQLSAEQKHELVQKIESVATEVVSELSTERILPNVVFFPPNILEALEIDQDELDQIAQDILSGGYFDE